jgi:hypothetical protein
MLPLWQWFAAVTVNRRGGPGSGEVGRGPVALCIPNPAAAAVTQVLGPLGPVQGRGGGSDGGGSDDDASDACPLGSPSSSPTRETVRRRAPLVKAQLWPEMSPVMGGWMGRHPRWPLGGTV